MLVPKEISSGSKMAKREAASLWIGLESSPAPGPSGTGLRVTCRTDWSFLAPYQGRKTESGSGSVAVAAADVSDGAGCAGVEDGVDRKEAYEVKEEEGRKEKEKEESSQACEETGSTWPSAYVHTGIAWPLRRTGIGVFTYIESLPTYNYRLPILPRIRARLARRCLYARFTRFA